MKLGKLFAFLFAFAAVVVNADTMLYWTVRDTAEGDGTLASALKAYYGSSDRSETKLYATLSAAKWTGDEKTGTLGAYQALDTIVLGSAVDTNITGYMGDFDKYIVQIFNANEEIAYSSTYTYSDLVASSSTWVTDTMGMKADTAMVMNSNFTPAPEPTSGLLMLLGLAGLALKRKNV